MKDNDIPQFDDPEAAYNVWIKVHRYAASVARSASLHKLNYTQAYKDAVVAVGMKLACLARAAGFNRSSQKPFVDRDNNLAVFGFVNVNRSRNPTFGGPFQIAPVTTLEDVRQLHENLAEAIAWYTEDAESESSQSASTDPKAGEMLPTHMSADEWYDRWAPKVKDITVEFPSRQLCYGQSAARYVVYKNRTYRIAVWTNDHGNYVTTHPRNYATAQPLSEGHVGWWRKPSPRSSSNSRKSEPILRAHNH